LNEFGINVVECDWMHKLDNGVVLNEMPSM
jgi:hypothetical protein